MGEVRRVGGHPPSWVTYSTGGLIVVSRGSSLDGRGGH